MKKVFFFSLLFLSAASYAQTTTDDYFDPAKPKLKPKDRISGSISAGTGVSTFNKSTYYSAFIAPKISYQLNDRFKMNFGLMHYSITGNTFMPLSSTEALYNPSRRNASGNLLFAGGEYKLSRRVTFGGAVMTDVNNLSKNSYKAASLGLKYQTSNHSWISIETSISNGQSPYFDTHQGMYNFGPANGLSPFGGVGQDFTNSLNNSFH
ncbi:MAG: hypothetical protein ACJ77K_00910 [Bacteroidia bacterium]